MAACAFTYQASLVPGGGGPKSDPLSPLHLKETKAEQETENALLQLLLPMARLLVLGGAGIDRLIHAAKQAYLRAAIEDILPGGQRINVSRLSVATGMTRKEISSLLKDPKARIPTRTRGEQRALRTLRGWLTDPRFQNHSSHAATLPYRGTARSFVQLVKLYGGDVTPKAVQRELERMRLVETTGSGSLRLRTTRKRNTLETPSFFGFKDVTVPSSDDAAILMSRFSRRAAALLEEFQAASGRRGRSSPSSREKEEERIGLGVYLLRSEARLAQNMTAKGGQSRS